MRIPVNRRDNARIPPQTTPEAYQWQGMARNGEALGRCNGEEWRGNAMRGMARNGEAADMVYCSFCSRFVIAIELHMGVKNGQLSRGAGRKLLRDNRIPNRPSGNDRKTDRVVGPQLAPGPNVRSPSETF